MPRLAVNGTTLMPACRTFLPAAMLRCGATLLLLALLLLALLLLALLLLALLLLALPVLALLARPALAQEAPAPGDLVVNEILYDPPPERAPGEYVEVLNRTDRPFELSGFALADSRDVPAAVPAGTLAPGGYAVFVQDGDAFAAAFPGVPFAEVRGWPHLNNGGDTVQLLFAGGGAPVVIDVVSYVPAWGGEDVALERIDPAGSSSSAENFGNSAAEIGTPGAPNTLAAGGEPEDTVPPALEAVAVAPSRTALTARFSEALDPASVAAAAFSVEGGAAPAVASAALLAGDAARVELALAGEIASGAYALVARGVRDAAGNRLAEGRARFAVASGRAPAPGDVVVNELWAAPADARLEFVEVFNRTEEPFDLSRFRLADDRRAPVAITEAAALLEPGGYVVLARDNAAFAGRFPRVPFIEVGPWPALNNGGDTAVLLFGSGAAQVELDAVPFEPSWGGSAAASLERIDPAGPSARASNFGTSAALRGATPAAQNALFAPDRESPRPVFAREVLGAGRVFAVDFSEPLDAASVAPAGFALGGQAPASVAVEAAGRRVRLTFARAPSGEALVVRGVADLAGNMLAEARVPVAFVAAPPAAGRLPGDLVINEILYAPIADDFDERPNQPEYVELFNPTGRRLALEGYVLAGRPDERGEADSLAAGQAQASIAPGGFAVIYAARGGTLEDAFPSIGLGEAAATRLPVPRASLGLANEGDLVALHRPDGVLIDSVFYRPSWHSAAVGREGRAGRALERIDPAGPSNDATNWQTATGAAGGTPGRPNDSAAPPPGQAPSAGLQIAPSPFSPDGDGIDDVAFIQYALDAAVALARVRIYDAMGRAVYEREATLVGREGRLPWDGRSGRGDRLDVGVYVVLFEALDADGGQVEVFKRPVVLARPLD